MKKGTNAKHQLFWCIVWIVFVCILLYQNKMFSICSWCDMKSASKTLYIRKYVSKGRRSKIETKECINFICLFPTADEVLTVELNCCFYDFWGPLKIFAIKEEKRKRPPLSAKLSLFHKSWKLSFLYTFKRVKASQSTYECISSSDQY